MQYNIFCYLDSLASDELHVKALSILESRRARNTRLSGCLFGVLAYQNRPLFSPTKRTSPLMGVMSAKVKFVQFKARARDKNKKLESVGSKVSSSTMAQGAYAGLN